MSKSVLTMFSSESFMVSFRSVIHFEFIFVHGVRKCSNFILLHVAVQFSQHHLLKRRSLLHCMYIFASLVKDKVPIGAWVYLWASYLSTLIFLFLCYYCTLLTTVALWYSLKSGSLITPALFFSRLLWLLRDSIQIVKFSVLDLWKMPLVIW